MGIQSCLAAALQSGFCSGLNILFEFFTAETYLQILKSLRGNDSRHSPEAFVTGGFCDQKHMAFLRAGLERVP